MSTIASAKGNPASLNPQNTHSLKKTPARQSQSKKELTIDIESPPQENEQKQYKQCYH